MITHVAFPSDCFPGPGWSVMDSPALLVAGPAGWASLPSPCSFTLEEALPSSCGSMCSRRWQWNCKGSGGRGSKVPNITYIMYCPIKGWGIRFQFLWEEQQNHIAKGRAYRQWEHCCGPFANKLTQKISDFCSRRWSLLGGKFLRYWRGVQRCWVAQRVTKCSLQLAYSWVGWLWPPFLCPGTSGAIDLLGGLLPVSSLMGSWPGGDRAWPCDQSDPDWRHHRY